MGCKSSKSVPVTTVTVKPSSGRVKPLDLDNKPSELKSQDTFLTQKEKGRLEKQYSSDSLQSLGCGEAPGSDRQGSAGSKFSKHSEDSGLGDNDAAYINENSDPLLVQAVEKDFVERELDDFMIVGTACPRRLSAKDKERQEEQRILATLQSEGLITRPKSRAVGGLSFEIVEENTGLIPRPPPRLAKLELRRKKKKKKQLTEEAIRAKLEKAEERRKQHENERLERINQLDKDKNDVQTAMDSFVEHQKKAAENQIKKVDVVLEKREQKLQELREKMRAKEEHAAEVRRRKRLHVETVLESQGEYNMDTGSGEQTTEVTQFGRE